MVPPSQRRLRDAHAAGLRPRAPSLVLAAVALSGWVCVDQLGPRAPRWIHAGLERALAGDAPPVIDTGLVATLALALLGIATLSAVLLIRRRPSPRSLGVSPSLGEIPPWLALASCVAALALLALWLRPAVAASARAVDVAGVSGLWGLWSAWLARGLLALALAGLGVAVIERLVSARRLWQGLHLTREQARERALASGERRR